MTFCLPTEVRNSLEVLTNVRHLHVRVKSRDAVMESLLLVLKFSTEVAHPFNLEFACAYVEAPGIESLSERLLFDEAVEYAVHRDFSLKLLVACSDSLYEVLADDVLCIAIPQGLLHSSLVLEGSTGVTIPEVCIVFVPQEFSLSITTLCALEGERGLLGLGLSTIFLFSSLLRHVNRFFIRSLLWVRRGSET